jgi:biotin carboxyl carrier protein
MNREPDMAEKRQASDACTIVIFRGAKASPLRFSFSGPTVKRLKILGFVLVLAQGLFLTHYVIQSTQIWELKVLREEAATLREQTSSFSSSLEDLKRRMLSMKEVNQRLRIMLGIEDQRPADMMSGKGGSEVPMDGGQPIQGVPPPAQPMSVQDPPPGEAVPGGDKSLAEKIQRDIAWLERHSTTEERSLEELIEAAKDKSARWAATPSIWPVRGWVTSGFGARISPFTNQLAMHDGLDIGAPPSTPVRCPANGHVVSAGFDAKMGNVVLIDHGYGIETEYGHLAKILVRQGQRVKRGDIVALVGSTGLSTGPHLHYMVKVKGQAVNPHNYILD